jgi:4-hydroxybenzoate polyprenyltransferase
LEFKNLTIPIDELFSRYLEESFLFVKKSINRIENLKIKPLFLAAYFCLLIAVRDLLEQWFFSEYYSIHRFLHHFFFYLLVLVAGILIISLIGKIELTKTTLIVASGFILIILPPLFDHLIFIRNFPYEYVHPQDFLFDFLTFFLLSTKAGLGIMVEIAAILILAPLYVLIRTRSIFRTIFTGISLYTLVGISASPSLYLPIPEMTDPFIWQYRHTIYFSFYLGLFIIIGMFFLKRINNAIPKALFIELSSFRTLHFILMVIIGLYFNINLNFFDFPDFLYSLISIILIIFLWLSTLLINNVYDLPIDKISNPKRPLVRGIVNPFTYLNLSSVFLIMALLLSLVLGAVLFILSLLSVLSSLAYSMPPLRLRKKLLSSIFIGWGSLLAFYIGYFMGKEISDISVSSDTLFLSILIFIAFSIGPLTKDLKDYEGDLQHGVKTFFTLYGLEKGKRLVSFLLFLSLLIPLLLFHRVLDVIFFGLASCIIAILFYLKEKLVLAYLGYCIVFFYCVLRMIGFI